MTEDAIPEEVRNFIITYIDTIAQIEALVLLHREQAVSWSAASLSRRLYVPEQDTAELLRRFHADGFVVPEAGSYRYQCASPELQALVGRATDCYVRRLIPITNLVHSKSSRIHEFADAFKLRKDP